MKKDKPPTLALIKRLMQKLARENGIPGQFANTWRHSTVVWRFADKIGRLAKKNGYQVDLKFLKIAGYVHDIGRMMTGSKASKILKPAIFHFYEGCHLMKKLGYPRLARVCISHAAGAGLDKKTNKQFGFLAKDFFPKTIEEKIVAYADSRTDYKKGRGPFIHSFNFAYQRFKRYPGCGKRLKENHQFIQKITNYQIK